MEELTIQELRNIQLDILQNVDEFCHKHGIRYSLCGGSLLGAVRHQGYIPWDDDIDIMMPRPDYEKFIKTYSSETDYLIDFIKEEGYRETFVKICRKGTLMIDALLGRGGFGVNIDLFPIDGVPEKSPLKYVDDVLRFKEKIAKFCPYYKIMSTNRGVWFAKYIVKRLTCFQFMSILHLKQKFNEMLINNAFENNSLAGVISGSYGYREVVDKDVFLQYCDMQFEGFSFKCISRFDEYLSSIYGDYMMLPPKDKQVAPHHYKVYQLS